MRKTSAHPLRRVRAFTLLELIITTVIIGILAGVAYISYSFLTDRAYNAQTVSESTQMGKALQGMSVMRQKPLYDIVANQSNLVITSNHCDDVPIALSVHEFDGYAVDSLPGVCVWVGSDPTNPAGAQAVQSITVFSSNGRYAVLPFDTTTIGGYFLDDPSNTDPTEKGNYPPSMASGVYLSTAQTATTPDLVVHWTSPAAGGAADYCKASAYALGQGGVAPTVVEVAGDATTAVVSGLAVGVMYTAEVVCGNAYGESAPATAANPILLTTPPGAPTDLVATTGPGQAALSWTAPADTGFAAVSDYRIEYKSGALDWAVFNHAASTNTSAIVTGLTGGTAYTFRVAAVNEAGPGAYSNEASATIEDAPAFPENLAGVAGDNQVSLTWSAVAPTASAPVNGYRLLRKGPGDLDFQMVYQGSNTSYLDMSALNGETYEYQVAAYGPNLQSPVSPSVSVDLFTLPSAPTDAQAVSGDTEIAVSWTAASDGGAPITVYTVTGTPSGSCTIAPPNTSCMVTGLVNGTSYTFTVRATNKAGDSPESVPTGAIMPAPQPPDAGTGPGSVWLVADDTLKCPVGYTQDLGNGSCRKTVAATDNSYAATGNTSCSGSMCTEYNTCANSACGTYQCNPYTHTGAAASCAPYGYYENCGGSCYVPGTSCTAPIGQQAQCPGGWYLCGANCCTTLYNTCNNTCATAGCGCKTSVPTGCSTTYSCPSGGSLSGTTCLRYTCPGGYTLSGSSCYQDAAKVTDVTYAFKSEADWAASYITSFTVNNVPVAQGALSTPPFENCAAVQGAVLKYFGPGGTTTYLYSDPACTLGSLG